MQTKNNKAGDVLGLQAEMYKACVKNEKESETCELVRLITATVQKLWKGEDVPASWLDSIITPLYKKRGTQGLEQLARHCITRHRFQDPRYSPKPNSTRSVGQTCAGDTGRIQA